MIVLYVLTSLYMYSHQCVIVLCMLMCIRAEMGTIFGCSHSHNLKRYLHALGHSAFSMSISSVEVHGMT